MDGGAPIEVSVIETELLLGDEVPTQLLCDPQLSHRFSLIITDPLTGGATTSFEVMR